MNRVFAFLRSLERGVLAILLAGMVAVIFIATVCRYTQIISTPWAEESARYMMIWLAYIGAGMAARTGSHFGVEVVVKRFSDRGKIVFHVLQTIIITILCAWIFYFGIVICLQQLRTGRVSPSIGLPMWFVTAVIPFGALSTGIQNFLFQMETIRALKNPKSETEGEGGSI